MSRPMTSSLMNSMGYNKTLNATINDVEFRNAVQSLIKDIIDGTITGMTVAQEKTYTYAKVGLLKFRHTRRKESLKGLIKPDLVISPDGDKISAKINQISIAGKILEYKINTEGFGGVIRLSNPHQRRAHIWLREHHKTSVKVSKLSQISKYGSFKNNKPMQNALDEYLIKKGVDDISKEIIKNIKPVYN